MEAAAASSSKGEWIRATNFTEIRRFYSAFFHSLLKSWITVWSMFCVEQNTEQKVEIFLVPPTHAFMQLLMLRSKSSFSSLFSELEAGNCWQREKFHPALIFSIIFRGTFAYFCRLRVKRKLKEKNFSGYHARALLSYMIMNSQKFVKSKTPLKLFTTSSSS